MRISDWSSDVCSSDLQLSRPAGSRCDERISLSSVDEQHRTLQLTQRVPWVDRMVEDFGFQPFRTGERPLAVFIARGVFDAAIKRIVPPAAIDAAIRQQRPGLFPRRLPIAATPRDPHPRYAPNPFHHPEP